MSELDADQLLRLAKAVERVIGTKISVDEDGAEGRLAEAIVSISDQEQLELLLSELGPPPTELGGSQVDWPMPQFQTKPGRTIVARTAGQELPLDPPTFADSRESIEQDKQHEDHMATPEEPVAQGLDEGVPLSSLVRQIERQDSRQHLQRAEAFLLEAERARQNMDEATALLSSDAYSSFASRLKSAAYLVLRGGRLNPNVVGPVEIVVFRANSFPSQRPRIEVIAGNVRFTVGSDADVVETTRGHDSPLYWVSLLEAARAKLSAATSQVAATLRAG